MKTAPPAAVTTAKPKTFRILGRVSDFLAAFKAKKSAESAAAIAARGDARPRKQAPPVENPPAGNARSANVTAADGGHRKQAEPVAPPRASLGVTRVQELEMAYALETDPEKKSEIFTLIKAARGQEEESTDTLAAAYAQERDPSTKAGIFLRIQAARVAEAVRNNEDAYSRVSARIAAKKRR